jgi:hypothetical protein
MCSLDRAPSVDKDRELVCDGAMDIQRDNWQNLKLLI